MNHLLLFRVRPWNNGMRCMSCYVPIMPWWHWKHFLHHPPFVERIRQLSMDNTKKLTVSGAFGFHLLSSSRSTQTNSRLIGDMRRDGAHQKTLWCVWYVRYHKSYGGHMQVLRLSHMDQWVNHLYNITNIYRLHSSDVIWLLPRLKSPATPVFVIAWIPTISQQTHTGYGFLNS